MKLNNKKKKQLFLLEVVIIVVFIIIAVVMFGKTNQNKNNGDNQNGEADSTMVTPDENGEQFMPEEPEGIALETDYISLTYPEELDKDVKVKESKKKDVVKITFSAKELDKLELFTIILSKSEQEGTRLGILEDPDEGDIIVTMDMNAQNAEDWTDEEFEKINALQERVNDIIIQFFEDPRFVPEPIGY